MTKQYLSISLLALLFLTTGISGQDEVSYELIVPETQVRAGESFTATLRATLTEGWHLYSMEVPPGGPIPTTITVVEGQVFTAAGEAREPEPTPWFDQNFNMQTNYFEGQVDFEVPVAVKPATPAGEQVLNLSIRFMLCNDSSCLPPQTKEVSQVVQVEAAPPGSSGGTSVPFETLAYVWFAMTMGALALLTPCVFPMIPITVSYFTKREAETRGKALFEAGLYSVGIVATFTILGFALTFMFGAGGINRLAASPMINFLIAGVFVLFAFSLFGVIELRLPNSWLNAVNRKSAATSGVLGILLMSLTFALTSFTCTVPFVGTVMVAALQGDLAWAVLGVTSFAVVFSLPFFVLALFPSWLQNLPKSGNWMNSVKITMGFLELAAAMKFISNVDLVFQWEWITRPVFITVWLAISLVTAAYLLGWFRFPHETRSESVGTFRVMFAIGFFAISFYLLRGLFGFPLGEMDAFLPPRDYGSEASVSFMGQGNSDAREAQGNWLSDYDEALQRAQVEDRNIFIDFTGYTCTNCRWMEANVFTLPEVESLFQEFVLVRLYTDGTGAEHEDNRRFERERFGTIALPFYALVSPRDETIAVFPGLTRDKGEFVSFLEQGLEEGS